MIRSAAARALLGLLVLQASPGWATTLRDQSALVRTGDATPGAETTAYGTDLFGDRVNPYTGALEFLNADVALPGNDALPVGIGRRLVTKAGRITSAPFGDWDLDIPAINGEFATGTYGQGWNVINQASTPSERYKRCSSFGEPDGTYVKQGATITVWEGFEYWSGTNLYVPGAGSQEIVTRDPANTQRPADANAYPLVTKAGWQIRCLASLHPDNINSSRFALGEGFVAISPSGTQYRFDWLVARVTRATVKTNAGRNVSLPRVEVLIYPTLITDRHGNTVTYQYNRAVPTQLTRISASDGRSLNLSYVAGTDRVESATDGTRTWRYAYTAGPASWDAGFSTPTNHLSSVTLPDASTWQYALQPLNTDVVYSSQPQCPDPSGTLLADDRTGTITHPSGATGSFTTRSVMHARKVDSSCTTAVLPGGGATPSGWNWYLRYWASRAIVAKSISGPGLSPLNWSWQYPAAQGGSASCSTCPDRKTVTVTDPRGVVTRHTYGIQALVNEGLLLQLDEGWNGSTALRSTAMRYRAKDAGPYPARVGWSPHARSDAMASVFHTPLDQRIVTQQGVSFTWQANAFDAHARPTSHSRYSSLGTSRTELTSHVDHLGKWVLGQIGSVTEASTGATVLANNFDPSTANLLNTSSFGRLDQRFTYYPDGTLWTRADGLNQTTTYSNYKRGVASNVLYADGRTVSVVVNDLGLITAATDANGFTTQYGHDAIGRLNLITPPGADSVAWNPTHISFEQVAWDEYGLGAGHWRQTLATGNARTVKYFDALWQPRLTRVFDAANEAGTAKTVLRHFDADGRVVFESYPARSIGSIAAAPAGVGAAYDGIGRPASTVADSELGPLTTAIEYLSGFQKRVTNPRGHATTTSYQVFDAPSEAAIATIAAPETLSVSIGRDVFGKPGSITRSGTTGGAVSVTRRYVYDGYQRLCKTIEPEIGATIQDYDGANNTAWRATGLALTGTASCDTTSVPAAAKVVYTYDARNRMAGTGFGDGSPAIGRAYTPDGLLAAVVSNGATWTYAYNKRGLLVQESLSHAGQTYTHGWGFDANASLSQLSYPDGASLAYAPNALGEPTQVGGHAWGVSHHPDGTVAGYTLGNGITHSLTQNLRGLPSQNRDVGVLQDQYGFDANGNVTAITDQHDGVATRSMGYDGLDRLTAANAPGVWGGASYAYDALDNLRASVVGARSSVHSYGASNRLESINTNGAYTGFAYDAQGNVTGRGSLGLYFDQGNRLTLANGVASYSYDGLGRRVALYGADGVNRIQLYSRGGQLLYGTRQQGMSVSSTRHVYLGGKLIAEVNSASGTEYVHTDALGSPVARTNSGGALVARTRFEAYGKAAAGSEPNGIGFTGHVNDPASGLVYMQQRYYDPVAGRFLSVDPVVTDWDSGSSFNRYVYAQNNPYRYTDPDGRFAALVFRGAQALAALYRAVTTTATAGAVAGGAKILAEATSGSQQAGDKGAAAAPGAAAGAPTSGADSADRPSLLDPKGEQHILDGDRTGGGHRPGTGNPGKSEFPNGWSDDRIKGDISDVATDPASSRSPGRNGREVVRGTRGGIDIEVIVEPNGRIVTGYPTNVPRNPR